MRAFALCLAAWAPKPKLVTRRMGLTDFDLLGGAFDDPDPLPASPQRRATPPRGDGTFGFDHDFTRMDRGGELDDEARVHELLAERIDAKKRRDFDHADNLRSELFSSLGVKVWDRTREWEYCGGPTTRPAAAQQRVVDAHDYEREAGDEADVDVDVIDAMILDRLRAKMSRNFVKADEVRDALGAMGVRIHDGSKKWRGGISAADADPWTRVEDAYTRIGDMAPEVDEAAVQRLVADRAVCRRRRFWRKSDEILDALLYDHGVEVDDDARSWKAVSSSYSFDGDAGANVDVSAVEKLLAVRSLHKMRRRYDEADRVRDELADDFGVVVDDRSRTWRLGARRGD